MQYQELVTEAAGLVSRARQTRDRLIELTLEAVDSHSKLQQDWAADIGVQPKTVSRWYRYGHDQLADGPARSYQEWREEEETGGSYTDLVERGTRNLPAEKKAEVVRQWLADDEGGRTRAEVGKVVHEHDVAVQGHVSDVRESRANEGERPDFETTEVVRRVLTDYAQLRADSAKLPAALSDRSKSMLSYAAHQAQAIVDYHANLEHEHGLSDQELADFFESQP